MGDYRAVVSNPSGSVTSQVATLVVDGVGIGGFEADVNPLPAGNNAVTVSDWVRVGRLVAGLESPINSGDFTRADCAPRTNAVLGIFPRGNGALSVADWTQAGRYAAGLDPLTPAGGPMTPGGSGGGFAPAADTGADASGRQIRLLGDKTAVGEIVTVRAELHGAGNENAIGFTVSFDAGALAFEGASLGADATGVALNANANQAGSGLVGLVLAKPTGQSFSSGLSRVAELRFRALARRAATTASLTDAPVTREVSSATAEVLGVDWLDTELRIVSAARWRAETSATGAKFHLSGEPGERYRVEASSDLQHWETLTTVTADGSETLLSDPAGSGAQQRFYRASLVR